MFSFFLFITISLNIIIYLKFDKISNLFNTFDKPDHIRKIHKTSTPNIGGLIIFVNFTLASIYLYLGSSSIFKLHDISTNEIIVLVIFSFLILLIGFIDDKKTLSPGLRLFLLTLLFLFFVYFDKEIRISELRITFLDTSIYLNNFSITFTIFCLLLLTIAINMIDGINLLCGTYFLLLLIIYSLSGLSSGFIILLSIGVIHFLILNVLNKCFLGDNGSYLISFILSYIIIKSYKYDYVFFADEIFLILIVPGLDMVRVSIQRVLLNKNPFEPDRIHFHHLLSDRFSYIKSIIFILAFYLVPISMVYFEINTIFTFGLVIFLYLFTVYFLLKQKIKNV
tara:strand:- start:5801 stop:6814 length:1014 start_codon:yes stop_codon:yes gene_type:complete